MSKSLSASLERYQLPEFKPEWGQIHRGIEKESLRVTNAGGISRAAHPQALGSALTNPFITTDFSEALLEFITPVFADIAGCLDELEAIHRFTLQHLDPEEMLWVASMPCPLADDEIPIARYGSSNIGRMKTLYRKGLTLRYGALMQVIAGIHYNFSMPDAFWSAFQTLRAANDEDPQYFRTNTYLHLIRNFHRYSWLLIYLFGASPAACKCFAQGRTHNLRDHPNGGIYLPDATCLRMGNLGYKSEAQESLFVCYNELDTYIECLHGAIHTSYPRYEALGLKANGDYQQINTNLLQLENEFYSTIRPKPSLKSGQRPLDALRSSGIEYIEVRALDLNPYLPLGIDAEQIHFLDTFLLHCLLAESPVCDRREFFEVSSNISKVVEHGRNPELLLNQEGQPRGMREWANALVADMEHAASLLDSIAGGSAYQQSLEQQRAKLEDAGLTPSGRILADMEQGRQSFFELALKLSRQHRDSLRNGGLDDTTLKRFQAASAASLLKQQEIEAADDISFDAFLAQWNAR